MFRYFPQVLFAALMGPILYFGWQNKKELGLEGSEAAEATARNARNGFIAIF